MDPELPKIRRERMDGRIPVPLIATDGQGPALKSCLFFSSSLTRVFWPCETDEKSAGDGKNHATWKIKRRSR